MFTLCIIYIFFSTLSYIAYGDEMNQAIIIMMMPASNKVIQFIKICMCINIVFSYSVTIYPCNQVLQSIFLPCLSDKSTLKSILSLLLNGAILFLGCYLAIIFYVSLDSYLAFSGVILGSLVVLIIPAMCHYKLIADR